MHDLAFTVNRPAVGEALFIGSTHTERTYRDKQRALEPSAVLVAAFDIHIGGPEALVALHSSIVGGTGVKPAVQRVSFLGEVRAAAMGAYEALREKIGSIQIKPGIAALLFKDRGDRLNGLIGADRLFAVRAVENGNGETPAALAGNAPVGPFADHGTHALFAPFRQPADVFTGGDGFFFKRIDRAEPLGGCTEDNRALAAPAVGVAVDNLF